jgi:hypothetical protein
VPLVVLLKVGSAARVSNHKAGAILASVFLGQFGHSHSDVGKAFREATFIVDRDIVRTSVVWSMCAGRG